MSDQPGPLQRGVGDIPRDLEPLILVDDADREIGHLDRANCHAGSGVLHRAFSLFIFNGDGALLVQQRSGNKRLWPLYWSNSCCSHPRRAESLDTAIHRRLHEELGLRCGLRFLYKFQYQAQFDAAAAERELCSVYIGRSDDRVRVDPAEVNAWRWIDTAVLQSQMSGPAAARFTPWFRLEWERLWREHRAELFALR